MRVNAEILWTRTHRRLGWYFASDMLDVNSSDATVTVCLLFCAQGFVVLKRLERHFRHRCYRWIQAGWQVLIRPPCCLITWRYRKTGLDQSTNTTTTITTILCVCHWIKVMNLKLQVDVHVCTMKQYRRCHLYPPSLQYIREGRSTGTVCDHDWMFLII